MALFRLSCGQALASLSLREAVCVCEDQYVCVSLCVRECVKILRSSLPLIIQSSEHFT